MKLYILVTHTMIPLSLYYEKHMQKARERKSRKYNTHAASISIEGRKMAL